MIDQSPKASYPQPWSELERIHVDEARYLNAWALLAYGHAPLVVNGQHYLFSVTRPCNTYAITLYGTFGNAAFVLHLDVGACLPELSASILEYTADQVLERVAAGLAQWLQALETLSGSEIQLQRCQRAAAVSPGACAFDVMQIESAQRAHIAIEGPALAHGLMLIPSSARHTSLLRCHVRVPVCLAGPTLEIARLRQIVPGDVLVVTSRPSIRVPLHEGVLVLAGQLDRQQLVLTESMTQTVNQFSQAGLLSRLLSSPSMRSLPRSRSALESWRRCVQAQC